MTTKSLEDTNTDCESPLYHTFNNVDQYIIEGSNEDKYLIFGFTNQSKTVL